MYAVKVISKKKLNKMFMNRKKKAEMLLENEMAILKKLVIPSF